MFIDKLKKELVNNTEFNKSTTENLALGYKTTGKALLDLNFKTASLRNAGDSEIIKLFVKAFYENKLYAMKWLFFARDVRGGLGERRLFRIIIKYMFENNIDVIAPLIKHIPEYGRWDDLWELLDYENTDLNTNHDIIYNIIKEQLSMDKADMAENKPISLLAKWLPSINASAQSTSQRAYKIRKSLNLTQQQYRKMLSKMRGHIKVIEKLISANQWGEVDYSAVPSRANLLYKNAFLAHDKDRRNAYLDSLKSGETKINAGVLFPHDIVHSYMTKSAGFYSPVKLIPKDNTLEALWENLPNKPIQNTLVVADGSASMLCTVGNTSLTALAVANALAIYFSQRNSGQFKNKYITFSQSPQLVDFSQCSGLHEKLELALEYNEVTNTNIEAVFELILSTALNNKPNKLSQNDMPKNILIISDMEFDHACTAPNTTQLFKNFKIRYKKHGYELPRLVFWNVNSRTGTIPLIQNSLGVALVSGFSVNIANMIMSTELDPYKALIEQLLSERYEKIMLATNH